MVNTKSPAVRTPFLPLLPTPSLLSLLTSLPSGASSDFKTATALAYSMVTKWGMSDKVGFIHLTPERKISSEQRQLIDAEVKRLLDERYKFAKQVSLFLNFYFILLVYLFMYTTSIFIFCFIFCPSSLVIFV